MGADQDGVGRVECGCCGVPNKYELGTLHQCKCGNCGKAFWAARVEDILGQGWNAPWRKWPFLLFLSLLILSLIPWLQPAAPLAAGTAVVAWFLRSCGGAFAKGTRSALLAFTAGAAFVCAAGIVLNSLDSSRTIAAADLETAVMGFAYYLQPFGDMSFRDTCGLVLCVFLTGWLLRNWQTAKYTDPYAEGRRVFVSDGG